MMIMFGNKEMFRISLISFITSSEIVQDDFQLICFDMVSEPSTPGAFVMKEGKEIGQQEINKSFNKSDRIDRIFNDILKWDK